MDPPTQCTEHRTRALVVSRERTYNYEWLLRGLPNQRRFMRYNDDDRCFQLCCSGPDLVLQGYCVNTHRSCAEVKVWSRLDHSKELGASKVGVWVRTSGIGNHTRRDVYQMCHLQTIFVGQHNSSIVHIVLNEGANLGVLLRQGFNLRGVTQNCTGQRSMDHLGCIRVLGKMIRVLELVTVAQEYLSNMKVKVPLNAEMVRIEPKCSCEYWWPCEHEVDVKVDLSRSFIVAPFVMFIERAEVACAQYSQMNNEGYVVEDGVRSLGRLMIKMFIGEQRCDGARCIVDLIELSAHFDGQCDLWRMICNCFN